MALRGNGKPIRFGGSVRFYSRLTPSVAKSCYLSRVQAIVAAEWFVEEDFADHDAGGGGWSAKDTAYDHAWEWYHTILRNDWVQHDYVFVAKPIWDAGAYVVDVGLTEIGERALFAIQQGYVWDHPDLVEGTKGINIQETLRYWRRMIAELHPDTPVPDHLIESVRSLSSLPELELRELATDLDNAMQAHAAGMFWDQNSCEPDIERSMTLWRKRIKNIQTHDDPLFKRITDISDHPAMKPLLSELTMCKILLE
jgi:hypothetical protein